MNTSNRAAKRQKKPCSLVQMLMRYDIYLTLADVKACVEHGGSIYEKTGMTMATPIHMVSSRWSWTNNSSNNTSILKYLLSITPVRQLKAVVNATDTLGKTPLHYAAHSRGPSGCVDTIKILVNAGANIEARDNNNETPLFVSVNEGNVDAVKALIGLGANVNTIRTRDNSTPLHSAIILRNLGIVKILMKAGANLHALDNEGKTPYDKARPGEMRTYLKPWEEKYWMAAGVALHRTFPKNIARSIMQKARK